jgi:lipopolysaccharide transport system permease protein
VPSGLGGSNQKMVIEQDIKEITNTEKDEQWDMVIEPKGSLFDLQLKEVWHYRDLMWLFVRRDFVAQYKQTVLGPVWHFIQPILTTLMFLLIFGHIAKIPTDNIAPAAFYMSGITMWNYFSTSLNGTASTFVNNAGIFGKVYFPRLVLPISVVLSNIVRFAIQFLLLTIVMVYYHLHGFPLQIGFGLLIIPLLLVWLAALGLGLGIIISSVTTKYRDFTVLLGFVMQLMMYASPVVYPLSYLNNTDYKWIINLNPVTPILEAFRLALFGRGTVEVHTMLYSIAFTVIALFVGIIMFNRVQKSFMDTV